MQAAASLLTVPALYSVHRLIISHKKNIQNVLKSRSSTSREHRQNRLLAGLLLQIGLSIHGQCHYYHALTCQIIYGPIKYLKHATKDIQLRRIQN